MSCIVLSALLAIVGFVALILAIVFGSMKSSDAYSGALARAKAAPAVIAELGTPIRSSWYVGGRINVSGSTGYANLSIPIYGPKSKATIYVEARKKSGEWRYRELVVEIEASGKRIDLLQNRPDPSQEAPPAAVTPGAEQPVRQH